MADEMDEQIEAFMNVTGIDDRSRAQFFLQAAGNELHVALSTFYDEDAATSSSPDLVEVSAPPPRQADPVDAASMQGQPPPPSATAGAGRASARAGNIHSLLHDESDDSDEEKGQAFYAGGSETSGQQILGPSKKKKNTAQNLFDAAKENGAEVVESSSSNPAKSTPVMFHGAGFKLGSDVQESQQIGESVAGAPQREASAAIMITFWQNGFSIDDGPLRSTEDPANKPFLEAITRGEVPSELRDRVADGEVHVNMQDKREEEYAAAPKQKVKAFSGAGNMLGSPTPNIISAPASVVSPPAAVGPLQAAFKIDESQPITTIQIRLADGTRLVSKFNHENTIQDIRNVVRNARPNTADNFNLLTTFPNKVLTEYGQTISSAKLLNAVIVQRIT